MSLEDISRLVGHSGTNVTELVYRHQIRPPAPVIQTGATIMDRLFGQANSGVPSSGTRLTDEFRYVLDMINIMFGVGWFRAAAILRRVTGSGSMLGR